MSRREKPWNTSGSLLGNRACRAWEPATDIYQSAGGWVVKFDLAGVEPDDLTVDVSNGVLRVTGTRRDRTLREGFCHYQMEITYSRFERVITLPDDLAGARVETEYRNGLLTVTFDRV
ncbi:MAG: Hsp20/alpha crystallin family protein [Acidobacteria bacterium]|nr:Hsp20/alpha crystallin family protein [Acidobacteriota bacterium]